jgi:hypothetical protein
VRILSLLQSGQFDASFNAMRELEKTSVLSSAEIQKTFMATLTQNAGDITFLEYALSAEQAALSLLNASDRLAFAKRLLELGFAVQAQDIQASFSEADQNEEYKILAAEIALALEKPFLARAELIGSESPDADHLRARADEMVGQYDAAYDQFSLAGHSEETARAAWLAEKWESQILEADPVLGTLGLITNADMAEVNDLDGILSRGAEAAEESSKARLAIEAILSAPTLQISE